MIFSAPNRARFSLLATEMAREPLVLFTGAGASVDSGFPTWASLLSDLHELALKHIKKQSLRDEESVKLPSIGERITPKQWDYIAASSDQLWRAEVYRKTIPSKLYEQYLRDTFGPSKGPGETAQLLAKIGFRQCLTTNYENSLEGAWKRAGRELDPVDWTERTKVRKFFEALETRESSRTEETNPYLVYLHGRAAAPQDMVFTERDYIQRYVLSNDSYPRLLAMFMFHRVLFVGFSLNDAQFQTIFRVVNAHLGENLGGPGHYMLTASENPDDSAKDELTAMLLQSKYGISPVFYNPYDRHQGLKDVLRELHRLLRTSGGARFKVMLQQSPFANPDRPAPRLSLAATAAVPTETAITPGQSRSQPPKKAHPLLNPDPRSNDGRKGMFGRSRRSGDFRLWAHVERDEDDDDWFLIEMSVFRKDGKRFDGPVTFFLHPSFSRSVVRVNPKKGPDRWEATLERYAWGAFTVGAVIGRDMKRMDRRLELDLATLPGAPAKFRSR